jgi:hypothetical protein
VLENLVNEIIDFVSGNLISTGFVVNLFLIYVTSLFIGTLLRIAYIEETLTRATIYSILTSDLPLNRTKIPLFSGVCFRIVIRKGTLKIWTRFILLRIARRFQRNKIQIFTFCRSRDNRDWKS